MSRAQQCEVLEAVHPQAADGRREGEFCRDAKAERGGSVPSGSAAGSLNRRRHTANRKWRLHRPPALPNSRGCAAAPRPSREEVAEACGFNQSASALRLCPASPPPPSAVDRASWLSLRPRRFPSRATGQRGCR